MKKIAKLLGIILAVSAALLLVALVVAAVVPIPTDPDVRANHGAGSSSVLPSYSGLQRAFPAGNQPADNPATPEKVELGRLLFFDPVLSANNEMACATCHHPDLGFSDGRSQPLGLDGSPLERNTPTLWNVAYAQALFWDGRETSLEAQSTFPLTHVNEMGVADTAALVADLAAIPEYQARFAAAFADGLTYDNVGRALAAFQRSLLSQDSPFDRYAAGDFAALTAQQRRGLTLFRSGATRCFECHGAPTFASDTFRVVGLPSADPGRAGVVADGLPGAFKVPTLRNIALSAPYMHDGSLATLEEVVDFYAAGGGRAHGHEGVDVFVQGFTLDEQERADLVAFLMALTDEGGLPERVTAVPSGLPVVQPIANPMREIAAAHNVGGEGQPIENRPPQTIRVQAGERIQTAVDRAQPGDTVEIPYGIYHERVVVDISDFTLRGLPNEAGDYPILDGQGVLPEGVLASGNNFTVSHLHVRNYTDNGVLVEGVTGVHFHDLFTENVGTYGIYPVQSTNVLIERVVATGVDDAGIYAGQCENVIVRDSEAYGNVLGIELENTINGEVYNNHVHNNTLGILIVLLPQLTSKISADTRVYDNVVENNNLENFAPGGFARIAPRGTGILLLATDNAEVTGNTITGNDTVGVAVFGLERSGGFNMNEVDVGPQSENNWVHGNTFADNGRSPDDALKALGIPGSDVIWDGQGINNRFDEPDATAFPPLLPGSGWPNWAYRAYYNILNLLIGLVG